MPADIGERLARQAGRGHAGRDQDQDVGSHGNSAGSRAVLLLSVNRVADCLYGLPARRQTGYVSAPSGAAPAPIPPEFPAFRSRAAMNSFEINKILGALLFTCLCLLSLNIAAEALFHAAKPAKPGFEVAVDRARRRAGPAAGGAGRADREAARERRPSTRARTPPRNAPPATPSARASRTASARTFMAWSAAPKGTEGGFNYSAAHEGQGRQLDRRGPEHVPDQPEGASCPAPDELCRLAARQRARRRDRLPELEVGQSGAAAQGGAKRAGRRRRSSRSL